MSGIDEKGFKKFDDGKLRWDLVPEDALEEVVKILHAGANRYGDWNWLDNADEVKYTRYINALERHFKDFKRGEDFDNDSGRYQLAHIICNALFMLQYQIMGKGIDDRKKTKLEIERKLNQTALAKFKDE